jgi:hypothetical protein
VSHDLLHHVEPRLFFDLMHMFELFEFGFMFEFELSSLEKIKIKSFRKSLEKKKSFWPIKPILCLLPRPRVCVFVLWAPLVSSPPSSNLRSARPPWSCPHPRNSRPLPTRPTPTQTPSPCSVISSTRRKLPARPRLCAASSSSSKDRRRSPCPHVRSVTVVEDSPCPLPR